MYVRLFWEIGTRVEALLDKKVEIRFLNAVFPAFVWRNQQFTEKLHDRKSTLVLSQFIKIGIYHLRVLIWVEARPLMRPRGQYLLFLILKLPDFDD